MIFVQSPRVLLSPIIVLLPLFFAIEFTSTFIGLLVANLSSSTIGDHKTVSLFYAVYYTF